MPDHHQLDSARREASMLALDIRDALAVRDREKALGHISDAEGRLSNLRQDLEHAARALGRRPRFNTGTLG